MLSSYFFDLGFKVGNWSFLEAGHGKGPADGIGGAVKRSADSFVAHGGNITDAQSMVDALRSTGTTVKLYLVTEAEVESIKNHIPTDLQPVPQTMKLHQVQLLITDNQFGNFKLLFDSKLKYYFYK